MKQIDVRDYYAPIVGEFEHFVLLALVRLGNGAYGASIRREIRERSRRRKHYLIDTEGQKGLGRAYRAFTRMAEGIEGELGLL